MLLTLGSLVSFGSLAARMLEAERKAASFSLLSTSHSRTGHMCEECLAWIEHDTAPDAAIMGIMPTNIAWWSHRPAVAAPDGGLAAILRVAAAYDVRYVIDSPINFGSQRTVAALRALPERSRKGELGERLAADVVFEGARCRVIGLRWRGDTREQPPAG